MKILNSIILLSITLTSILRTPGNSAVVLTGQSNMNFSAPYIQELLPDVLVINCSKNGSSITKWQRGQVLYEDCVQKVHNAQSQGYVVEKQFHFQGERDSYDEPVALQWKSLTLQFLRHFRTDIGNIYTPVIFAQLGALPTDRDRPYWDYIKARQVEIDIGYSNLTMIVTEDIVPYCPETGPHWCADGYREIAGRFVGAIP